MMITLAVVIVHTLESLEILKRSPGLNAHYRSSVICTRRAVIGKYLRFTTTVIVNKLKDKLTINRQGIYNHEWGAEHKEWNGIIHETRKIDNFSTKIVIFR